MRSSVTGATSLEEEEKVFWASAFSVPEKNKNKTQSLSCCCPFNMIKGNREAIVTAGGSTASGTSHTP